MLIIYTSGKTNRLLYIFDLIFNDILHIDYKIITEKEEFSSAEGIKISYCKQPVKNELFFCSTSLLYETGIKKQELNIAPFKNIKALFPINTQSSLPFDPFAASFYLLSRYEEYLPCQTDKHNRFPAAESIAYKHAFLQKPVVNIWALEIKKLINKKYPEFVFPEREYRFLPTYDIDIAYAYKYKGFIRTLGGYCKDLVKFSFNDIKTRTKVLINKQEDPYYTFDRILGQQKKYGLTPIYFFSVGDYGKYDKNIPFRNLHHQNLIRSVNDYAEIGIHPSYASNKRITKFKNEITRLSSLLGRDIKKSRQHFLKLSLPETYRHLIEAGITDDYTMGYASQIGFRAGICTSFYFYDLERETATKLRIHPFAIMDGAFNFYLKIPSEKAFDLSKQIIDAVKKVNGTFISLWHNQTVAENDALTVSRRFYEKLLEYAVK